MNATPLAEVGVRPVVAVFNSADGVIDMLRLALETSGFAVVSAKLSEIQAVMGLSPSSVRTSGRDRLRPPARTRRTGTAAAEGARS
jgi:hypothetical protein